jgi:hypothetical protein
MGAAAVVAGTAVFVTSLSDVPIRWKLDKFVDRNPQFKERYNDLLDLHKSLNREYRYKSGLFTVINLLGKNKFHNFPKVMFLTHIWENKQNGVPIDEGWAPSQLRERPPLR